MKSTKEYFEYYESNAKDYPYLDDFSKDGHHWHRTSFFLEFIKQKNKVLDCGCSNGGLSKYISENTDCEVFSLDIASFFVKNTKKNAPKSNCIISNLESIPFKDETFDIVIIGEVLEHILNEKKAVRDALRVLKKNGYLLITTPSSPDKNEQHLRYLGKEELEKLIPNINVRYNQFSWLSSYKKENKQSISLAMIVRDEENVLARCLDSVYGLVDEIIIVDTGSIDKTKEIAKKYTDLVFDFKWVDDFAKARNYSFSKCTKDFILWLDADDVIKEEDRIKIRNLDLTDREIVILPYQYYHDEFDVSINVVPRERLLKRSLNLKWNGEIHEHISIDGKKISIENDISIHHYSQAMTSERNLRILERIVKKDKTNARNTYYLAKELLDYGKIESAIKYFKRFVGMNGGWWEDKYQAYFQLALCYYSKNMITEFKKMMFKSIEIEERRAEPYYYIGTYYFDNKQWEKAIFWYEICVNLKRPQALLSSYRPAFYTWKPCLQLCLCYNSIGNIKKAYEYNKKVLEYRPQDQSALNNDVILYAALKRKKNGENKKLNLGCGNKTISGYVNVDVVKTQWSDEVFDMKEIPYQDNTISAIRSEHSLEHLSIEDSKLALKEFYRVLVPGGELLLYIPDLDLCCKNYLEANNNDRVNNFPAKDWYRYTIFGIQKDANGVEADFQFHKSGFSKNEIQSLLEQNNFIIDYLENFDGWKTPSIGIRAVKPVSNLKIGWIAPLNWDAAQTRIRVIHVDRWLHSKGYQSKIVNYPEIINQNYDVAIVGKTFDLNHFLNIRMLKKYGKTVFCDICENILEYPWVKETLVICDKVITCSYELEKLIKPINSNVITIEDAFED